MNRLDIWLDFDVSGGYFDFFNKKNGKPKFWLPDLL